VDYAAGALSNFPSGTFTLLTVQFQALTTSVGTAITFNSTAPRRSDATFGTGSVLGQTVDGQVVVTAPGTFAISGHMQYYAGTTPPVGGASVGLTAPTSTGQSDAAGNFAFLNLPSGNVRIEPFKVGDFSGGISALDASFALQNALGLRTFTVEQAFACDVTGNGTVSALDASRILQFKLGLITRLPVATTCASDWTFFPVPTAVANQSIFGSSVSGGICQRSQIAYEPLTQNANDQNFLAALFGDCTGNWQPASGGGSSVEDSAPLVRTGRMRQTRAGGLRLPVYVDAPAPWHGLEAELRYDDRQLYLLGVSRTIHASGTILGVNDSVPGRIKIAMASARAMSGNGAVLVVRFAARGGTAARSAVSAVRVALDEGATP
jgi:hypothetical protein